LAITPEELYPAPGSVDFIGGLRQGLAHFRSKYAGQLRLVRFQQVGELFNAPDSFSQSNAPPLLLAFFQQRVFFLDGLSGVFRYFFDHLFGCRVDYFHS
jgi:hypothetical protein